MKLITEICEDIEYVVESKGKELFIEGVFLQSNVKNRNGRVYPKEVLEKEVKRYTENYINKNRFWRTWTSRMAHLLISKEFLT